MSWVMNSKYTYHICVVKEFVETLELKEGGMVLLRNNKFGKVQDMRIIRLKMFDDQKILLQEVGYVSKLKKNLLFIFMLYWFTN